MYTCFYISIVVNTRVNNVYRLDVSHLDARILEVFRSDTT